MMSIRGFPRLLSVRGSASRTAVSFVFHEKGGSEACLAAALSL